MEVGAEGDVAGISRRTVFLGAVTVFGTASVVSATLSNEAALIALRFIKGASAGFTVPAGLSILTTTFAEGPARNRALSIYSACGASGFSFGLVLGGLLTEVGWRLAFLTPGPVAMLLVVMGWRLIPRTKGAAGASEPFRLAHFDLFGALTATASLLLLVYAVVEAPIRGWTSPWTVGLVLVSIATMGVFVLVELRHPRPLVRLGILRNLRLVHANLGAFAMFGSYAAFQFTVTLYVQDSLGWSPIGTALAFLPTSVIIVAMAPWVEPIIDRLRAGHGGHRRPRAGSRLRPAQHQPPGAPSHRRHGAPHPPRRDRRNLRHRACSAFAIATREGTRRGPMTLLCAVTSRKPQPPRAGAFDQLETDRRHRLSVPPVGF